MSEGILTACSLEKLADMIETGIIKALAKQEKPKPERLYTRAEAARLMGKQLNTIKNMIQAGRIKATTDGKYISQAAIDEYLNLTK